MTKELNEKEWLIDHNWIKKNEMPLIRRLKYISSELNSSPHINQNNSEIRKDILKDIFELKVNPVALADPLDSDKPNDLLVAEIDRYGLPHRTVLNQNTGLLRTDPYYNSDWLNSFYGKHYRSLYSNAQNVSTAEFFVAQVNKGQSYLQYIESHLKPNQKVLEIGCGMGGILLPFKLNGYKAKGVDLGSEFINTGKELGLNLTNEDIDVLIAAKEKYELIILSHILEHIVDIEQFLEKIKKLLAEGGKIFVVVPGIRTIDSIYKKNIHTYLQNAHCWSFTEKTLSALLIKSGFNILEANENVYCLAEIGMSQQNFDLVKEAADVISYLNSKENEFLSGPTIHVQPTLTKRITGFIKRRFLKFFS